MNHVVITADDFGLHEAVNEAVEIAHRQGVLTAASLMVSGPAAADAVARARAMPGLRVGLHLVLVDGQAAAAAERITDLADAAGRLPGGLGRLALRLVLSASLRRQAAAEIRAQLAAFRATGLQLDHVNVHKHFHLHPVLGRMVVVEGKRQGMRALRVPAEPAGPLAAIDPGEPRFDRLLIQPCQAMLRVLARRAGLLLPDAVFGLAWSGAVTTRRLSALLKRLPPGLVEIYLHPATVDVFPGSAEGYRYTEELAALTDPVCIEALRASGFTAGGYADAPGASGLARPMPQPAGAFSGPDNPGRGTSEWHLPGRARMAGRDNQARGAPSPK